MDPDNDPDDGPGNDGDPSNNPWRNRYNKAEKYYGYLPDFTKVFDAIENNKKRKAKQHL